MMPKNAIGCLAGGRLGYVLFYNLDYYSTHVLDLFKIWQGGMSFPSKTGI
jgi:phosphatidylglycerol:prolipoprotein diacylglycerol transferase